MGKDRFCFPKIYLYLCLILVLIASTLFISTSIQKNKNIQDTKAVIGGTVAQKKYPYMVTITTDADFNSWNHTEYVSCTGTLINQTWILTAGHCLTEDLDMMQLSNDLRYRYTDALPGDSFNLYIGNNDVRINRLINEVDVEEYFLYDNINVKEDYKKKGYLANDIALIRINKPSIYFGASKFPLIPAKTNSSLYDKGNPISAMGYGCIKMTDPSGSPVDYDFNEKLNEVSDIPILEPYDKIYSYSKTLFTAGWPVGDERNLMKNICQGDSGGPILTNDKKYIIGISANSWYIDKNPFFATRVIDFSDWIADTIAKNKSCYYNNRVVYSKKYNPNQGYYRDANSCVFDARADFKTGYKCAGPSNKATLVSNANDPCYQQHLNRCATNNWKGYKCSGILEYGKTMVDQGVTYTCTCTVKYNHPTLEAVSKQ